MGLYNNRIVVKVGTSTLTNDAGKSDLRATDRLVWDTRSSSCHPAPLQ